MGTQNEGYFTLREISDKLYYEKYPRNDANENTDEDLLSNFYISQQKKFQEILEIVNLKDIFEKARGKKEYRFIKEDAEFVEKMITEYTGRFKDLRRSGSTVMTDYTFISEIRIRLLKLLRNLLAVADDYSKGEQDRLILQAEYQFDVCFRTYEHKGMQKCDFIGERLIEKLKDRISGNISKRDIPDVPYMEGIERYQWLIGFSVELAELLEKWDDILLKMDELRRDEYDKIADDESLMVSQEQRIVDKVEFEVCEEVECKLEQDGEYQKLLHESDDLEYLLIRETGNTKKPIISEKKRNKYKETIEALKRRRNEVKYNVIRARFPQYLQLVQSMDCEEDGGVPRWKISSPYELLKKAQIEVMEDQYDRIKRQQDKA